jgi:hypothetical protein
MPVSLGENLEKVKSQEILAVTKIDSGNIAVAAK